MLCFRRHASKARSTPPSLGNRGATNERCHMAIEGSLIEGLGQHVRVIHLRGDVLHDNFAKSDEFANLEIATLNMARALARFHVFGQLDRALVVDEQASGREVVSKFAKDAAEVQNLCSRNNV